MCSSSKKDMKPQVASIHHHHSSNSSNRMQTRYDYLPSCYTESISDNIFEDYSDCGASSRESRNIHSNGHNDSSAQASDLVLQSNTITGYSSKVNNSKNKTTFGSSHFKCSSHDHHVSSLDDKSRHVIVNEELSRRLLKRYNYLTSMSCLLSSRRTSELQRSQMLSVSNNLEKTNSRTVLNKKKQQEQKPQMTKDHEDFVTTPLLSALFPSSDPNSTAMMDSTQRKKTLKRKAKLLHEEVEDQIETERLHKKPTIHGNIVVNNANTTPKPIKNPLDGQKSSSMKNGDVRKKNPKLNVITSQLPKKKNKGVDSQASPFNLYRRILKMNNYDDEKTFESSSRYYSKVSNLQKASYGNAIIKAALNKDCETLKNLISQGLSPNPSNQFGDSLMNIVCKRGYFDVFKTLIECGASIRTCDQLDRTPLHFAVSNPCFELIDQILQHDINMLNAKDSFGKTPLEYITNESHSLQWKKFLIMKQPSFWPSLRDNNGDVENVMRDVATPPLSDRFESCAAAHDNSTVLMSKTTRKNLELPNPENALSPNEATLVSNPVNNLL